jgi:hypothetical protein
VKSLNSVKEKKKATNTYKLQTSKKIKINRFKKKKANNMDVRKKSYTFSLTSFP